MRRLTACILAIAIAGTFSAPQLEAQINQQSLQINQPTLANQYSVSVRTDIQPTTAITPERG
jgi:hypothetical protein